MCRWVNQLKMTVRLVNLETTANKSKPFQERDLFFFFFYQGADSGEHFSLFSSVPNVWLFPLQALLPKWVFFALLINLLHYPISIFIHSHIFMDGHIKSCDFILCVSALMWAEITLLGVLVFFFSFLQCWYLPLLLWCRGYATNSRYLLATVTVASVRSIGTLAVCS